MALSINNNINTVWSNGDERNTISNHKYTCISVVRPKRLLFQYLQWLSLTLNTLKIKNF